MRCLPAPAACSCAAQRPAGRTHKRRPFGTAAVPCPGARRQTLALATESEFTEACGVLGARPRLWTPSESREDGLAAGRGTTPSATASPPPPMCRRPSGCWGRPDIPCTCSTAGVAKQRGGIGGDCPGGHPHTLPRRSARGGGRVICREGCELRTLRSWHTTHWSRRFRVSAGEAGGTVRLVARPPVLSWQVGYRPGEQHGVEHLTLVLPLAVPHSDYRWANRSLACQPTHRAHRRRRE